MIFRRLHMAGSNNSRWVVAASARPMLYLTQTWEEPMIDYIFFYLFSEKTIYNLVRTLQIYRFPCDIHLQRLPIERHGLHR